MPSPITTRLTTLVTVFALGALTACSDAVAPNAEAPDAPSLVRNGNQKITICHAAGRAGTTHYVTITVSENASYAHLDEHGTPRAGHEDDYLGACRPPWTVAKTLIGAFGNNMVPVGTNPVVVPLYETRWIEFQIVVTAGSGTATLTDLAAAACDALPAGFRCVSGEVGDPANGYRLVDTTFPTLTTGTTITLFIDVINDSALCGVGGPLTNVARLASSDGAVQFSQATVQIVTPACQTP